MMVPIYADATAAGGDSNGSTALAGNNLDANPNHR
jgi:hypothetical protein